MYCIVNTVNQRSILCALVKLHQHEHHVRGQQQEVRGGRRDYVALGSRVTLTVTVPQSKMVIGKLKSDNELRNCLSQRDSCIIHCHCINKFTLESR